MPPCTVGLDVGTTSISAVAVDERGTLLRAVTRNHHADRPGLPTGHAEQDPQRILNAAVTALRELMEELPATPVCLGLTGQMHGVVLLDAALQPVSQLITWQDRRALAIDSATGVSHLERLLDRCSDAALLSAGCRPSAGFLGTTLYTLRETGSLPREANRAALIIDWLTSQFTGGELITDRSNAGSTGLFDLQGDDWSDELLAAAHVDRAMLPRVAESGAMIGQLASDVAAATGLPTGLPVCNAIGDNQAAIVGSIPAGEEVVHINIGTGGQLSRILDDFRALAGMETRSLPLGRYMLVGAGLAGGDALAWVKRTLAVWLDRCGVGLTDAELYRNIDAAMMAADDDAGGLECAPFFRGTRANPAARGTFQGVDNDNFTPGNIGRAVLNGIAAGMEMFRDLAMNAGDWPAQRIVATGNAVRRNPLLIQRLASVFDLPVDLPVHREEAAYGAALLAGSQTGLWPDLAAAGNHIQHERTATPRNP
ncbi:MAG: sedoheptulokinase [Planctomycetaceae bacterium]